MGECYIYKPDGAESYYFLPRFKRPSDTPMMADTARVMDNMVLAPWVQWGGGNLIDKGAIHLIHNGQANIGYPDGHVSSLNDGNLWESTQKVRVVYLENGFLRQR